MNTIRDLYDLILEEYGKRGCWISELAVKLGFSIKNANCLTYKIGYRRVRALAITSFPDFASDVEVQATLRCIFK